MEDDPDIREVLRDMLEPEGYEVATAEHGEEALTWLRTHASPCAILLESDDARDGWSHLLAAVRAEESLSGIPVVVLSAAGPESAGEDGRTTSSRDSPSQSSRRPCSPSSRAHAPGGNRLPQGRNRSRRALSYTACSSVVTPVGPWAC